MTKTATEAKTAVEAERWQSVIQTMTTTPRTKSRRRGRRRSLQRKNQQRHMQCGFKDIDADDDDAATTSGNGKSNKPVGKHQQMSVGDAS
jgi:hypothetical protein